MSGRSLWIRIAIGTTVALISVVAVPVPAPAPERVEVAAGVAAGLGSGVLLFVALARARPRAPDATQLTLGQLGFLIGWAWVEEVVWRRLVLGGVALLAGAVAGLVVATALFALAHRRSRPSQLLTGAVFGAAYIGTGRLSAAVASHAAYNVLVAGARARDPAGAR